MTEQQNDSMKSFQKMLESSVPKYVMESIESSLSKNEIQKIEMYSSSMISYKLVGLSGKQPICSEKNEQKVFGHLLHMESFPIMLIGSSQKVSMNSSPLIVFLPIMREPKKYLI